MDLSKPEKARTGGQTGACDAYDALASVQKLGQAVGLCVSSID